MACAPHYRGTADRLRHENLEGFEENSYWAEDGGYFIDTEWLNSKKLTTKN